MGPHTVIGWLVTLLILAQRGGALTGYHYVIEPVTRTKQVYYAVWVCCPGWRVDKEGVKCSIHSQDPTVLYCPRDKSVRATGKTTQVTWKSPVFKEPHNFPMTVKSTYGREWARMAWGDTDVHYLATSSNNYRTVSCDFVVSVKPPIPTAIISGYSNGQTISVAENDRLDLECRANYGLPPPRLRWYRNGMPVTNGTRYKTMQSDYLNYYDTVTTLTIVPSLADNNTRYTCQMVLNPVSYSVLLAVSYEAWPDVTFCPTNISLVSSSRYTFVNWSFPAFRDPRYGEPIDVVGNLGNATRKIFGYGDHHVIYIATNRRNKLTTECNFLISLRAPACAVNALIGVDSPVMCATWSRSHALLCIPVCPLVQDVLWTGLHPHLYICDLHGRWRPNPAPLNCSISSGGVNSFALPSYNYYNGSCTIDPEYFRSNMLAFASLSPYRALCLAAGYVDRLDLSVHCP